MIRYKCNKCGADLESPDSMIGKMETCPACHRRMKVKDPAAVAEQDRRRKWAARIQDYYFAVAGVTKEGRQTLVKRCSEGDVVHLVGEPGNAHDANAVAVCRERDGAYYQLEYVPRDDAKEIAPLLDQGWAAEAEVRRVVSGGGVLGLMKTHGLRVAAAVIPPPEAEQLADGST
jgi:hypothetical protein